MFKKIGVLAMVLAGAMFVQPVTATAAEWHNGYGARANNSYARDNREAGRSYNAPRYDAMRYRENRESRMDGGRGFGYRGGAYYGRGGGYYNPAPYGYGSGYYPHCR